MLTAPDVLKHVLAKQAAIYPDPTNELWTNFLGWLLMCETPPMDARLREATGARGDDRADSADNKKYWRKWRRNLDLRLLNLTAREGLYAETASEYAIVIVVWDDLCRGYAYGHASALAGVKAGHLGHLCAKGGVRSAPAFQYSAAPEKALTFQRMTSELHFANWSDGFRISNYGKAVHSQWGQERLAKRDCRLIRNAD